MRYGPFEWKGEAPLSGSFRVRVWDPADPAALDPVDESVRLSEPRWDPAAEREADWPDRIRWEVEWLDAQGGSVGFAEGSAERSPR